ncbi:winged helix-turn-helix domain-containing protein [Photobacterium phosphoreum]|uniref:winged helix-turn-helix domain-containing protein n=1 Tax=Photobacterium phosphoreum TaxID=659 RepID=UPI001E3B6E85|nr:winged helix-turn-helix domain-containing protein [Photobacterium phosphoreum]MCD9510453.1 restriction endonuclease [Photobacterium phosphoreum]
MISNYQVFMRLFLEVVNSAGGREVKLRDAINQLADRFILSEAEKEERLFSGKQTVLDNRIGWARIYLTKAGLLEVTRRAHFVITERGRKALNDPNTDIDNQYLKQFSGFIAFKDKKNVHSASIQSGENDVDGVINQDLLGVDQVKHHAEGNNVGADELRDFFGTINLKKAQKWIFITTSDFIHSAIQTTKDLGIRIVLINGNGLASLMLRYNIGSRDEHVLHIKRIDEEFFEV